MQLNSIPLIIKELFAWKERRRVILINMTSHGTIPDEQTEKVRQINKKIRECGIYTNKFHNARHNQKIETVINSQGMDRDSYNSHPAADFYCCPNY